MQSRLEGGSHRGTQGLRHRLLRPPGGFEGFRHVGVAVDPYGQAPAEGPKLRELGFDLTDFRTVRAIVTVSEVAHGLLATDSLSRARRRFMADDRADSG